MLAELSIRDIALIPSLHVRFLPGLNVLSGETGAGKSLVVGSLRLLCGARPPAGFVRQGAPRGIVEGIFEVDPDGWIARELTALGIEPEDGEVILCREIAAEGKGRARANGRAIPLATLTAASEILVDLHGQHDHQSLLRPASQLAALDEFAGLLDTAEEFARTLREWRAVCQEHDAAHTALREDRERNELARLQLRELDAANVQEGERAALVAEQRRLQQAETLREASRALSYRLAEADDSCQQQLSELAETAEEAARHDEAWNAVAEGLSRLAIDAEEWAREADRLGERAVDDPERLQEVRDRLRLIEDLLLRHGPAEADLLSFHAALRARNADPEAQERAVRALEARRGEFSDKLAGLGEALSGGRKKASGKLKKAVEKALAGLGMEGTTFEARLTPRAKGDAPFGEDSPHRAGSGGLETAEFLLSANRGEELRPLRDVASGGEISRVMLALKSVAGEARGTATMVFDEIDAGVGGLVAARVAEVLEKIAARRQVICITHLATIASAATSHMRVRKGEEGGRTVARLEPVEGEERVREVARMLGSADPEGVALDHARELLTRERP